MFSRVIKTLKRKEKSQNTKLTFKKDLSFDFPIYTRQETIELCYRYCALLPYAAQVIQLQRNCKQFLYYADADKTLRQLDLDMKITDLLFKYAGIKKT